jgi:glycosyltransferase involved in cell wall biosynthesis
MSKQTLPLVSVWMITYNQEAYISQAIESVLEQQCDFDFEIVIGEDCSTDNTRKILQTYQKRYPDKIKLVLHDKNIGMVANQNATFKHCRGKYIAMLEGDDFWCDPYKLQKQVDYMKRFPQCHISFHPVQTTTSKVVNHYSDSYHIYSVHTVITRGGYFISTPSIMILKEVLSLFPDFFDEAPAGDYYIQILGSINGGALYIPEVMATYRVKAEGSWSTSIMNRKIQTDFMYDTLLMIRRMDAYLGYTYTHAFQKRFLTVGNYLCMDYLYDNEIEKFQHTVNLISEYVQTTNLKHKMLYRLQNQPGLLLALSKTYNTLKRLFNMNTYNNTLPRQIKAGGGISEK